VPGGLKDAALFQGKDSILSGPAGGIVGAARTCELNGFKKIVGFDMGGTSTDVCHYRCHAAVVDHPKALFYIYIYIAKPAIPFFGSVFFCCRRESTRCANAGASSSGRLKPKWPAFASARP
jgi:hypothetical protein